LNPVLDFMERLPSRVILLGAAGVVLVALGLVWAVEGVSPWWVGLFGLVGLGAVASALAGKLWLASLPLEVAPLAVRGRLDGHASFAFRVRLGRGRKMERIRARVRYVPRDGAPVELVPLLPEGTGLVGPFTVVVVDRDGACRADGAFELWVEAKDGGKTWNTSSRFERARIQTGRYRSGLVRHGTGVRWDRNAWREVEVEPGEAA
jgi:hypothetical protein